MPSQQPNRPGERVFALLLALFAAVVFFESYGISGFAGLTTGGVMPMLAAAVMLLSSAFILARTVRAPKDDAHGVRAQIAHVFPLRVVLFSLLLVLYVYLIPRIGFLFASGALLFATVWTLWRRGPLPALLVTAVSIAAIFVLFRVVFQVVLPVGSVWQ